ncbi:MULTISPECIES: hypothetical protein [Nocardia]|uniref:hypothetical protein n=1 Tax=Nocardia TaxID=1817 RepID=UPI002B4AFFA6|nr:hypothetical protein [Nocardia abscessus]
MLDPERTHEITARSGCRTTKVEIADHPESLSEDLARVEAVRDPLGPDGAIQPWKPAPASQRQLALHGFGHSLAENESRCLMRCLLV